jgi:DNA primase
METITLRGQHVKVDVRGELERFDWGRKAKWQDDKLIAVSPFRYDNSPSFFVNLTGDHAGTWKDSGYEYDEWASGNLIKLLAFMRQETYEETEEYLALMYGIELNYDADIPITARLTLENLRNPLPNDWLTPYKYRHPYLTNRSITERVQRMMRIGYDPNTNAVVIPWLNANGVIVNAKFRTVKGKIFWYTKNALPVKHNVYGMDAIYGVRAKQAVICEAEIDALTWMSWGVPAIALGGAYLNDKQAEMIIRSPIETLVVGADNDEQGEKLKCQIMAKLYNYKELQEVDYPLGYKDANEIKCAGLEKPTFSPLNKHNRLLIL